MSDSVIQQAEIEAAVEKLVEGGRPRFVRLWNYYQNPMRACGVRSDGQGSDRPYRQGQEWGLPSRITGLRRGCVVGAGQVIDGVARKEVVVENDIGWRVDTMVDYLFGKGITLNSAAPEASRREEIGELLRLILSHNGGILFLQQMALIGCVYGFVDVLVKLDLEAGGDEVDPAGFSGVQDLGEAPVGGEENRAGDGATQLGGGRLSGREMRRVARMIRLEIVEPARALPFLSREDWQKLEAYGQVYEVRNPKSETRNQRGWWGRWFSGGEKRNWETGVEVITATGWQRIVGGEVVEEGGNSLGALPVVHIQNLAMPFQYSGASDVEPLIPIQDELNTRLSDRANRITMQSFKMYLGKNIEGFTDATISPGKMWMTDNPDAEVISFGGDMGETASEEEHIADLREAMDKVSGVSPVAAGAIKDRIGNLTSAAALRITMFALLSKNDRKRTTYGGGLQRICELALAWLDHAGVYATEAEERQVEIGWPSPLPENESDALEEAGMKLKVGVPQEVVLRELGY
jgi:hypothetical protein